MERFKDKIVLVTGGTSGIGKATAIEFAKEGATVIICGRKEEEGEKVVNEIKSFKANSLFIRCDVSARNDIKNMFNQISKDYERIDFAFNNAGMSNAHSTILERDESEWDNTINTNLTAIWFCMKHELNFMVKSGKGAIVNTSAGWGLAGANLIEPYVAAKHGVIGLTKSVALEYSHLNIRINAICPGYIMTPIMEDRFKNNPDAKSNLEKIIPLRRLGRPEEIARVVLFLCSDDASFITGIALSVDGGGSAGIKR